MALLHPFLPVLLFFLGLSADVNVLGFSSAKPQRPSFHASNPANTPNSGSAPSTPGSFSGRQQQQQNQQVLLNVATIDGSYGSYFAHEFNRHQSGMENYWSGPPAMSTSKSSHYRKKILSTLADSSVALTTMAATFLSLLLLKPNAISTISNFILASTKISHAVVTWYLLQLELFPLLTKCVTGGLIAFTGDYAAQWVEYKSTRDKLMQPKKIRTSSNSIGGIPRAGCTSNAKRIRGQRRTNSLSIHGNYSPRRGIARFLECLLISSPLMHYGYDLFERILPVGGAATAAATGGAVGGLAGIYSSLAALSHVLADCIFLDGIFVGTGILATSFLEGQSLRRQILPNFKKVYLPTLKASVVTSGALVPIQFLSFRFLPVQLRVLSVNAVDLIWTGVVSFVSHGGCDSNHTGEEHIGGGGGSHDGSGGF